MRARPFLLNIFLLLLLAACAGPAAPTAAPTSAPPAVKVAASEVQRDLDPQALAADLAAAAAANQAFTAALYQSLRTEPGNLFFSPYSIQTALAMTYAGAHGETAEQMAAALRFTLPPDRLHPVMNRLDLTLGATGLPATGLPAEPTTDPDTEAPRPFTLNIANSLWAEQSFPFRPDFLDLLARNYASGLRLVDFKGAPEPARLAINDWVAVETNDRIQNLIAPGVVNTDTRLVLVNAIYFLADWLDPFEKESTRPQDFYPLDGPPVQVEMMHAGAEGRLYLDGEGFQAVTLPYRGRPDSEARFAMLFVLPDAGQFEAFESRFDAAQLQAVLAGLAFRDVILSAPKFEFEQQFSLVEQLKALGMPIAFDPDRADFSGMTGQPNLVISDVVHKAFVAVDEKGTEAAAATAVVVAESGAAPLEEEPVRLTLDRPFLFFIIEAQTGTALFAGRVLNPVQ